MLGQSIEEEVGSLLECLLERVVDDALQRATLLRHLNHHLQIHDLALAALERRDEQAAVRELTRLDARDVDVRRLFNATHMSSSSMYVHTT